MKTGSCSTWTFALSQVQVPICSEYLDGMSQNAHTNISTSYQIIKYIFVAQMGASIVMSNVTL